MFYSFLSQQQFESLLGFTPAYMDLHNDGSDISIIGEIQSATGWHVNALNAPNSWQEFEVFPLTPLRIFG